MKKRAGLSVVFVLFVFLVAGCATSGPKTTEAVTTPTPSDTREFSDGTTFHFQGKAATIMSGVEQDYLNKWGAGNIDQDPSKAEMLAKSLYLHADMDHDRVITEDEAKRFSVEYNRQSDIQQELANPIRFPSPKAK
ncbi:MAG: hypothetical protein ACYC6X_01685 [Minisyncoccota bacterium]